MVGSSHTQTLWEVGVDEEPLTGELAVQRGYLLSVENQKTVLEIPLFSIGYTYEVRHVVNHGGALLLQLMDQMFVGAFGRCVEAAFNQPLMSSRTSTCQTFMQHSSSS